MIFFKSLRPEPILVGAFLDDGRLIATCGNADRASPAVDPVNWGDWDLVANVDTHNTNAIQKMIADTWNMGHAKTSVPNLAT